MAALDSKHGGMVESLLLKTLTPRSEGQGALRIKPMDWSPALVKEDH